ncbi:MAG: type II toxin-antitoxin system prevent-host-death family antitoxin [bacterium]
MTEYNIHKAKTHLSRLIRDALNGEEIIISKGNRPMVKLVPLPGARAERRLDGAADNIQIADDFDEPLEDFGEYVQ